MEIAVPSSTRRLVIGSSIAAVALSLFALALVPATVRDIFAAPFLPHVFCYLNNKRLIALHLGSDAIIWLSYVAIAVTLAYLVRRTRHQIPFSWMFLAFGTFIIACGFTHFMEILVLWAPVYWLAGDVKLVTALASVVTAIALPALVPQISEMVASAHLSEERRLRLERANSELQHLSAHVLSVQDAERRRIARELHDSVGQYLAALKMSFDLALSEAAQRGGAGTSSLQDCEGLLERCTAEIRTMSYLLHPPLLEEMGLASAVPWYVEGFKERSGVEVILEMPHDLGRLPDSVEMVLFRVLQESLTNIHRHSGSKLATIRLSVDGNRAALTIQDEGKGFGAVRDPSSNPGVGIASMRERVRELSGEFRIVSGSNGTTVHAMVPL